MTGWLFDFGCGGTPRAVSRTIQTEPRRLAGGEPPRIAHAISSLIRTGG